jgi:aquaporin Z
MAFTPTPTTQPPLHTGPREGPAEATTVVLPPRLAQKLAVELIGTFFLVFTVGATVYSGSPFAPLAIGSSLMVMVYAGGHISGGHYNPAVTLAALVRGRIGAAEAGAYWITQLIAGVLAALVARGIVSRGHITALTLSGHIGPAFVAELLFTFALTYVVLNVATSRDHPDNSFYGLAIGFTVLVGAFAVGGITGGAFNPAVALGGGVMGLFAWSTLWVYFVAQIVAAVLAGGVFRVLNPADK